MIKRLSNLKLNKSQLAKICIFILILTMIFLAYGTTYTVITLVFAAILLALLHMKIRWHVFFTIELIFIAFIWIQYSFNFTTASTETFNMLIRLIVILIGEIVVYNFLLLLSEGKTKEDIISTFAHIFEVATIIMFFLFWFVSGFNGNRLSTKELGLNIFGIGITVGTSTTIGYLAGLAFAFSFICFVWNRKPYHLVFAALALLILILSGTRKTLILCAGIMIFAPVFISRSRRRVMIFIVAVLAVAAIVLALIYIPTLNNIIGGRLLRGVTGFINGDYTGRSETERSWLRTVAIDQFTVKPWFGWGLDAFQTHFSIRYSHCNYLEILYSCGVIGTVIFFAKYVAIFVNLFKGWKCAVTRNSKYMIAILFVTMLLLLVMEYWQVTYYRPQFTIVYIFILAYCESLQIRNNVPATRCIKRSRESKDPVRALKT